MNDNQITALAREYAESDGYGLQIIQDDAEMLLRWLSRRFCLVEKRKLQEEYRKVQKQMIEGDELGIHVLFIHGKIKKDLLKSLFPDFGKEVES